MVSHTYPTRTWRERRFFVIGDGASLLMVRHGYCLMDWASVFKEPRVRAASQ